MDPRDRLCSEAWVKTSSSANDFPKRSPDNPAFNNFSSCQNKQKWESTSMVDYGARMELPFEEFHSSSKTQSRVLSNPDNDIKMSDREDSQINDTLQTNKLPDWDPRAMLNNLSFLEQKIHQLQELVHLIVGRRGQVAGQPDELLTQQQQLITADLTAIIVQLISTAGSLLPSVKHTLSTVNPPIGQLGGTLFPSGGPVDGSVKHQHSGGTKVSDQANMMDTLSTVNPPIGQLGGTLFPSGGPVDGSVKHQHSGGTKVSDQANMMDIAVSNGTEQNHSIEEHELKDEEDVDEGENLPPGSYEILQLEKEEILAPHTHFCTICGKGFKRDANLRMHMRGHGDEYKTPAALAKPHKEINSEPVLIKRYSCPFSGCKRNKDHKKFQPLKTILCVKNHYKRTHCDKSYTCSRCNTKKFSVIADLKTHEKHCGKDKWLCSCGTTFSRKDKLFGHIALFQGHTPAIPPDENKEPVGLTDKGGDKETANKLRNINFSFNSNTVNEIGVQNITDLKGSTDDSVNCFSPLNFDTCNFGGFHEFPRPPFDDSESSLSFLLSGYGQKNVGESSSNDFQ